MCPNWASSASRPHGGSVGVTALPPGVVSLLLINRRVRKTRPRVEPPRQPHVQPHVHRNLRARRARRKLPGAHTGGRLPLPFVLRDPAPQALGSEDVPSHSTLHQLIDPDVPARLLGTLATDNFCHFLHSVCTRPSSEVSISWASYAQPPSNRKPSPVRSKGGTSSPARPRAAARPPLSSYPYYTSWWTSHGGRPVRWSWLPPGSSRSRSGMT